jgi:hypothetical protein
MKSLNLLRARTVMLLRLLGLRITNEILEPVERENALPFIRILGLLVK